MKWRGVILGKGGNGMDRTIPDLGGDTGTMMMLRVKT